VNVPPGLEKVVAKALEKNRNDRYQSAREFAAALTPFLTESISVTTQLKIAALHEVPQPRAGVDDAPFPATIAPAAGPAEQQAWERAAADGTRDAVQEFLHNFPAGVHASVAHTRLDEMNLLTAVDRMAEQGDVSSLSRLAAAHAGATRVGKAVRTALDRMADESLQTNPGEQQRAWDTALAAGTDAAWTDYLSRYPHSPRAFEARLRRDELRDFASAAHASTTDAWHSFLRAWPESQYRRTAQERLRVLEENAVRPPEPLQRTVIEPQASHPEPASRTAPQPVAKPEPPRLRDLPLPLRIAIEAAIVFFVAGYLYFSVRAAHAQADGPSTAAAGQHAR
jgi:hypothetical protein